MEDLSDKLIKRICDCGWSAYLVGGAVRDIFAGLDPHDYDIVTDATPEELAYIFPERKIDLVGENFLVTLIDGIEVSTYRSDTNTGPGRHNCITTACKTLEEDLSRRDFTFNAMAICPYTGIVIDEFNGQKDLDDKIIRFIGNADQRIYEDYLRMIRAARFACLINGKLEQNTLVSIKRNKNLISKVAPERIRLEFMKAISYKKPSIFFDVLHETGLLEIIFPELDRLYGFPGGKYHNETLCTHFKLVGDSMSSKDPMLRFAGYVHDIGKPDAWIKSHEENFVNHEHIGPNIIANWMNRYAFSNNEIKHVKNLIRFHMRELSGDIKKKGVRRMLRFFSKHNFKWKDWFKLKVSDRKGNLGVPDYTKEELKNIVLMIHEARNITLSGEFTVRDLPINGIDVMECMNIPPGPNVGEVLKKLLDMVVDNPSFNNKEDLITIIKDYKNDI